MHDLPDPTQSPEDLSDLTDKQRAQYLRGIGGQPHHPRLETNPGPHHWDVMEQHIRSWGPGARAAIAPTRQRPGGWMRHIIHAEVGPDGTISYADPQDPLGTDANRDGSGFTGGDAGTHWRTHTAYGAEMYAAWERDQADELYAEPHQQAGKIRYRNHRPSALRFFRLDDKTLHPDAGKYLVDRGTAGASPILPPVPTPPLRSA